MGGLIRGRTQRDLGRGAGGLPVRRLPALAVLVAVLVAPGPFASSALAATPAPPTLTATNPASPANNNSPFVQGTAESGTTVRIYAAPTIADCTSATLLATGTAADFASPGLQVSVPNDSTTRFRARATKGGTSNCSSSSLVYVEDSTPPARPTLTATSPVSPANNNSPVVSGTAEAGSTVGLYKAPTNTDCTLASLVATGGAAAFASPGFQSSVPDDSSTTFRATATDAAGNSSGCSSSSITYVEDSTPPTTPTLTDTDPDSPANNNSPFVKGTAAAGSTVRLYKAATSSDCTAANLVATGTAAAFASPGFQASVADDSSTTFRATAADAAGNRSACSSSSITYVEDSTPPAAPTLTDTDPDSPANDNAPRVKGTAAPGSTLRVYEAATTSDCTLANLAASGSTASFASPGLQVSVSDNSSTTFRATATDAAGNTSGCSSSSITYIEDSTLPAAPTFTGTNPASPANNNAPLVQGTADAGATVRLYTTSDCSGTVAAAGSDAAFASPGLTVLAADDTSTTFRATATDSAGNTSACSTDSITYVEDSTAPAAPGLTDTDPDSPANDNAPRVKGTAEAGSTVRLFTTADCSGAPAATGTAAAFASPGLQVLAADDSSTTFRATATDAAGNSSGCSTSSITYVEDSTPPAVPTVTSTTPASPANDNSPLVKGTAAAGSSVRLYTSSDCSGSAAATGTAAEFASPGIQASVPDDSSTTFRATASDAAGNSSACSTSSVTYVEDSTPPASPTVSATTPTSPANDNSPLVQGSAAAGSTVRLYTTSDCSGAAVATGTAAAFASPGLQVSVADDSSTTFRATAADAVGNTSACSSSSVTYVEDSTPPAAPTLNATNPASPANDNSPRVIGAAEAGSTVRIYTAPTASDCTGANLLASGSAADFASGGIQVSVADDSSTTFRARAVDAAGNGSGCSSSSIAYVEDSTPPAAPTVNATNPASPANDNSPLVQGTAPASSTVRLYTSSDCSGPAAASGTAAAFASPGLQASVSDDSSTTFRATASDAAGNSSPCSTSSITYIEDSTPPAAPTLTGTTPASPANNNSPLVKGTAAAGSTVRLYTSGDCSGGAAASGGAATFASPGLQASVPDDSSTTFRATASDAAGNTSECSSSSIAYVEDSTPPAAPIVTATAPPSPANNNSPLVQGSAPSGTSVRLYTSSDCSGTAAANGSAATFASPGIQVSVPDDSSTTFRATATDAAGNSSSCSSSSVTYVEDSTLPSAPTLTATNPASPANNNSPKVIGTAAGGSTVRVYKAFTTSGCTPANLLAIGTAADFASPGIQVSVADDTTTPLRATVTDAAANTSACSSSFISYTEDSTPPTAPTLTSTTPASPANNNSPSVKGTAASGSTVRLYKGNCSGAAVASGTAAAFASPGLQASVPDDSSTTFRATATDAAGNASGCSSSSITYVEDSTPLPAPELTATVPNSPANDNSPRVKGTAATKPWFLYVAPTAPHAPFVPDTQYAGVSVPSFVPPPNYFESDRSDKPPYIQQTTEDPTAVQTHRARQLRMLMSVDDMVSKLFTTLDSVGQTGDTLAFFLSDNGFEWGEHGLEGKPYPYTENANVPFYMRWPDKLAGGANDPRIVANIDIAPTILDAAGLARDPVMDGTSLFGDGSRDHVLLEFLANGQLATYGFPTWASIRTNSFQYTEYYADSQITPLSEPNFREYYDLSADPWQLTNYLGDSDTSNDPPQATLDTLHNKLKSDLICEGRDGVNGQPACGPSSSGSAPAGPPPNVMVVLSDDQRYQTMDVMPKTKALFQDQGINYPNAFVTTPLCCPSRSSILTGRYAHNTGVRNNGEALNLDQTTTIAHRLQNAGYRTGIYGKFLNEWPLDQNPPYFDQWSIFNNGPYTNFSANEQGQSKTISQYATSYVADQASQFISDQQFEPGATVKLYKASTTSGCTTTNLVATGSAADFFSSGFQVSVPDDSSTRFRARTIDAAGNASGCSTSSIVYAEDSTAPVVPQISGTNPTSPANNNAPLVQGTAATGATVKLYNAATTSDCTAANLIGTGTAAAFASPGVQTSVPDDSTTRIRARATDSAGNSSACSTNSIVYVEDSTPPPAVNVTATNPTSPANNNSPFVLGSADAGSTVRLYKASTTSSCTAANLAAMGTAADFASPGFQVSVADDTSTRFRAVATDAAGNSSACSSSSIVYVEDSTAPTAPQLTDTNPASPANNTSPYVIGTAASGSTVRLYKAPTTTGCTSANLAASGTAAQFASPGIQVTVPTNSTTTFRGTATDAAGNSSACSSSSILYIEDPSL